MRTQDASTSTRRASMARQCKVQLGWHLVDDVWVPDVDLTSLEGRNWVIGVDIGTNVDQPMMTATITLAREQYELSLAPLNANSKLNVVEPLLALHGLVTISFSEAETRAQADAAGSVAPWHEVFRGRIVDIDWGATPLVLRCQDVSCELMETGWLQRERWYGRGAQSNGVAVWTPETAFVVGDRVTNSRATVVSPVFECVTSGTTGAVEPTWHSVPWSSGRAYAEGERHVYDASIVYECTTAGTSGGTEPTWTARAASITDGGVVWSRITTSSTPATDGTAAWRQVAIPDDTWRPDTWYEPGDFCSSGRLDASPWQASTTYRVGDCVLRSTPTVHRYVCTSPVFNGMPSEGPNDVLASPPLGWNGQSPEARNVEDWDADASVTCTHYVNSGVPVSTRIGYAGYMRYEFTPTSTGNHWFRFSVNGYAAKTGSKLVVMLGAPADLADMLADHGSEEERWEIPFGGSTPYPVVRTIPFEEVVDLPDLEPRVLVLRFDSSQEIWQSDNDIPNVIISNPTMATPDTDGGVSGLTEPDWEDMLIVGDTILDGEVTWTRLNNDRSDTPAPPASQDRFLCVHPGWSAQGVENEPNWPDEIGDTTTEPSGLRWVRLGLTADGLMPIEGVLAGMRFDAATDNGVWSATPTFAPPLKNLASPGYAMQPFVQAQSAALDAMRRVAAQIGWDLRLYYADSEWSHPTWGRWRLTLFEPQRDTTTSLHTFTPDDWFTVRRGAVNSKDIRNKIELTVQDRTTKPDGVNPVTRRILAEDSASQTKYGTRWMGVGAGSTNEVNTIDEGEELAAKILSDLSEPTAAIEVEMPLRWWVELGDLYTFTADGRLWSEDQALAVSGWKHVFRVSGDKLDARTALSLRGKPTMGVRLWLERAVGPGRATPAVTITPQVPEEATGQPALNGGTVVFVPPLTSPPKNPLAGGGFSRAELHISTVSGFTPSSTTLWSVSSTWRFDLAGLRAGVTYYGRIIVIDARGNRSQPGPQFTLSPWGQQGAQLSLSSDSSTEPGAQVAFNTADWDADSLQDGDSIVVPADGVYRVRAEGRVTGLGAGATAGWVFKVGSTTVYTGPLATVGTGGVVVAECLLELSAEDSVGCFLAVSGTATVKAGATFSVVRTLLER